MSSKTPVKILLGTHQIGDVNAIPAIIKFDSEKDVSTILDTFYNRGYRYLDTGANYPGSEVCLGKAGAASRFTIYTKVSGYGHGDHEPSKVQQSIEKSLEELKTPAVDTMFLHVPDRDTPFEETLKVMNDALQQGKFKNFGLSNYSPAEVEKIIEICEQKGYVKPNVYEGHYNAVVRGGEKELFPILRKHNMAFIAYSPGAGGFFSGNIANSDRWSDNNDIGKRYNLFYGQPAVRASIATVRDAAAKYGISGHAAALRWTAFHSSLDGKYGDGVAFGLSKIEHLEDTLNAFEAGPLPADLAEAISSVYGTFEDGGPAFHL